MIRHFCMQFRAQLVKGECKREQNVVFRKNDFTSTRCTCILTNIYLVKKLLKPQQMALQAKSQMKFTLNWIIVNLTEFLLTPRVHPCLDYTLMDYSRLDYSWLDYRHLDYLWCLDYHRLDYFRLQGRSDYKDIWTIAVWTIAVWTILDYRDVWTTMTFGLSPIGLLRQTD